MKKIYRLLEWLDINQATDCLESLLDETLSTDEILELCTAQSSPVYIKAAHLSGWSSDHSLENEVHGVGIHRACIPRELKSTRPECKKEISLEGNVIAITSNGTIETQTNWSVQAHPQNLEIIFKYSDIRSLAQQVNEGPNGSTATLELVKTLQEQLAQERLARTNAEAKLSELRKKIPTKIQTVSYQHNVLRELRERSESTSTNITFPYATKYLTAMRDAALKFWQSHDLTKPAPHRIQKEVHYFLAERIGTNTRKLAELAIAIKPDNLPKS